ncbi:MAG: DUF1553 domain-containing protein [Rubripirellula sp.]
MRVFCLPVLATVSFFAAPVMGTRAAELTPDEIEFFEQRIRPILVQQCYECHNTAETTEANLSLDHRGAFRKGGDSGKLISTKPADSLLLKILRHEVEGLEMPEGGPKLDDHVIADFEKWLSMGAPDPRNDPPSADELAASTSWEAVREKRKQWWSFQPIFPSEIPKASTSAASDHPIDRFIHAKMNAADLKPAERADRTVLARRLAFALTGLPPSPKEVAQYVSDSSDQAFEEHVDRLLASDQFGERWSRHWMDWIRYAESHGSEGDPRIVGAYHYRDYLIRALNADVPYDQLVREHIAGDLLESPRINDELGINESQVATAHWRMVFHGFGPTDVMEEKVRFTDDAINVFSKAFLGLTVSCARCHNHKFDAISQADYYALFGIVGSTRPGRAAIDSPQLLNRNRKSLFAIKSEIRAAIAKDWLASMPNSDELPATKKKERKQTSPLTALIESLRRADDFSAAWNRFETQAAGASEVARGETIRHWDLSTPNDHENWFAYGNGTADQTSPAGAFAIHDEGESVIRDIFPSGVYSHLISNKHGAVFTSPSFSLDGEYDLWLRINGGGSAISRYVVQDYPRNGTVFPFTTMKEDRQGQWRWQKYDLSYWKGDDVHIELATANDSAILVQNQDRSWFGIREAMVVPKGAPFDTNDNDTWMIPILQQAESKPPESFLQFTKLFQQTLKTAVLAWQRKDLSDAQALLLNQCLKEGRLGNSVESLKTAKPLIQQYRKLESEIPIPRRAPALAEWVAADQALYERGDHKQRGATIPRRFLEAFDGTPYKTELSGRRELAENVLAADNPLTSRVIVNRIWHHLFGRGIVGTNDNFGRLGKTPTHPELLDYLANEFRTSDSWSIKSMVRRIVTSHTWRQDCLASEKAKAIDPENELYSHWSVNRLEAEAIRDAVLSASGQLNPTMFGEAVSGNTTRRSVYVKVIRNAMDPFLATFDSPVPFSSKGRRDVTNVPAQSLMMMNNSFVLNAARKFAERSLKQGSTDTDQQRVASMWVEALGRQPSEAEAQSALQYLSSASRQYEQTIEHRRRLQVNIQQSSSALQTIVAAAVKRIDQSASNEKPVNLNPVAEWSFETSAQDSIGELDLKLRGTASISQGALLLDGNGFATTDPVKEPLREKTLEALVQLSTLDQAAGGAMTVQDLKGAAFDSIVFAERKKGLWLAGSDHHRRTKSFDGPPEVEAVEQGVHLVITYTSDGTITCYRNGQTYGKPYSTDTQSFNANEYEVVFGMRHGKVASGNRMLRGRILHARLYNRALTADEVSAAATGTALSISPQQITQAMSEDERKRRDELQTQLATLRSKMKASVNVQPNQQWVDLAHSLFNMKEFIYVR